MALSPLPRRRTFVPRLLALEDRALPSTFTVLNLNDAGPGSLRAAVLAANANPGADRVAFRPGLSGTIHLTSGQLTLTDDVTVDGPGANRLAVSGNDQSRVFEVRGAGTDAFIDGLTITRGLADKNAPTLPGFGGGIMNQGNLTLSNVVVSHNRAVGDASVQFLQVGGYTLSGAAAGGGVANLGTGTVTGSTFTANRALGGDNSTGPDFPIGAGGGAYNDASLAVTDSSFSYNRAVGGNDCVSDQHNGYGVGGGIASGSVPALFGLRSAALLVGRSAFDHNQAVGGDDNRVTLPPSRGDGPGNGYGGGIIVYQGSAAVRHSTLARNRALGGAGGADQNGSLGAGGGIFFRNFIGGVTATVEECVIAQNEAIGGPGRSGGRGGDALGGGLAAGGLGATFSAPGTVTVSASLVADNLARGGEGGSGGAGSDGLGGGVYNDADSTLDVTASLILLNEARGGRGGSGGGDGRGVGGGVYNLGSFADVLTLIALNSASTSDDNCFGCY